MESQHTSCKTHTYCSDSLRPSIHLEPQRVLRAAKKNMPLSVQEQGVWPRCGQGTSRWVGVTYKVNSLYFYLCLHVQ